MPQPVTEKASVSVSDMPYTLLLQHRSVIRSMLFGGLKSMLPGQKQPASQYSPETSTPPPSKELLTYYRQWCQAPDKGNIPAHFVGASVAMPIVSDLTAQAPYPLLSVLNQGVRLQIHQPLPAGETIHLTGELIDASDDGRRARIHSRIAIGSNTVPLAITLDAIAAVMLKTGSGKKRKTETSDEKTFTTLGTWQGAADEGQTFFWLTGDFNPIHTLPAFAKRTRYKGCIMHGYGAFAQIYECLERTLGDINDIETRFTRIIPLPSPLLNIQCTTQADAEQRYYFRLIDDQNRIYQAGHFTLGSNNHVS